MEIQANTITKRFGDKVVLDGVSVTLKHNSVLGIIGPNGAGKSTLINILSGQLKQTSGDFIIDGVVYKEVPDALRAKMGVMPQEVIVWESLTLQENLEYSCDLYHIEGEERTCRIQEVINALQLQGELHTLAKKLSGGYRRRLNLALSILHTPGVVFLDEPTPGVDPQNRRFLWEFIESLKNDHTSIVLTDHYLEEAEKLCDYVVIIDHAKVIAQGTVKELKNTYAQTTTIEVELSHPMEKNTVEELKKVLKKTCEAKIQMYYEPYAKECIFTTKSGLSILMQLIDVLKKYNIVYTSIHIKPPSLEDVFLSLTGKKLRE